MDNIIYLRAAETFKRKIPFKMYSMVNEKITGTIEHTHDYIQIWHITGGCFDHIINNMSYRLTKGDLFVLPPSVPHRIRLVQGEEAKITGCEFSYTFINENIIESGFNSSLFDFAYLEPFLVSNEFIRPRLHLSGLIQQEIENLMTEMLIEYEQEEKYHEIFIKADLLKLLAIIARQYESCENPAFGDIFDKYREAINSSLHYINDNFTSKISMQDMCRIAMMSQTYFSMLFKQITGKTFIEYLNSLRIRKAMDMLFNSQSSVSEICFNVGFNDTTYFDKVFRKQTGLSPRQYRNVSSPGKQLL
jgi:AraC-like DNA-binding protein